MLIHTWYVYLKTFCWEKQASQKYACCVTPFDSSSPDDRTCPTERLHLHLWSQNKKARGLDPSKVKPTQPQWEEHSCHCRRGKRSKSLEEVTEILRFLLLQQTWQAQENTKDPEENGYNFKSEFFKLVRKSMSSYTIQSSLSLKPPWSNKTWGSLQTLSYDFSIAL